MDSKVGAALCIVWVMVACVLLVRAWVINARREREIRSLHMELSHMQARALRAERRASK